MTPLLFAIAVIAEFFLVGGQLLIKRAMLLTNAPPIRWGRFAAWFAVAIATLSTYFFLWLGLMQHRALPLSQQYAFDALAPVLLVLLAVLFLGERLGPRAWVGIGLITTGLIVISLSAV